MPALPIGAICNPGKKAIEAVLNPPKTNYIYFVANGTGGHNFSTTYEAHKKNVSHWRSVQKGGRKKKESTEDMGGNNTTQLPNE